jgi:signal transduction histidine kinase
MGLLDIEKPSFTTYLPESHKTSGLKSDDIREIIKGPDGRLMMASCGGGVVQFSPATGKFEHLYTSPDGLCNNYCETIFMDSKNNIWIGTYVGLSRWDIAKGTFHNFYHNKNDSTSLSNHSIYCVFEDSRGQIWVGTMDGLNALKDNTGKFERYSTTSGLSGNVVYGILEDDSAHLWISTDNGLNKLSLVTGEISHFGQDNGPLGQAFKPGAYLKASSGELLFGGNEGLLIFKPEDITLDTCFPEIYFTDFQIQHKPVNLHDPSGPLSEHISMVKKITLPHNQSFITIKYVGVKYHNANNINFAYMLKGYEDQWHFVEKERKATYTNLPTGEYTFMVKSTNEKGDWGHTTASLSIEVLPPWWKTIWFRFFSVVIAIAIIFALYSFRVRSLKRQKQILEKRVKVRTLKLEEANRNLKAAQKNLERQTDQIKLAYHDLNETNAALEERQQFIVEQTELIRHKSNELEEKNNVLEELNNTKDKLFSVIAHDLRNPFTTILGFSDILLKQYNQLNENKKIRYLENIYEVSNNTYSLLENLLAWSITQSNNAKPSFVEISVTDLIDKNLKLLSHLAAKKNTELKAEVQNGLFIMADVNMVNSIIQNLITNAIKFTENGTILVSAKRKTGFAEIQIADTGTGMSAKTIDTLFKVIDKKSLSGTKGEKGSGLGLVICKEFVDLNKGSIDVESVEGRGSTFTVTFPLSPKK